MVAPSTHALTDIGSRTGDPLVFMHGLGCNRTMWRFVTPAFVDRHRVVTFDHVGHGDASAETFDPVRHARLDGYADDTVDLLEHLDLHDVTLIGHSVSASIAVLAHLRAPSRVRRLVLVGPSPRYIDDDGYRGGFERADIEELLELLGRNQQAFSALLAPTIIDPEAQPGFSAELETSMTRAHPQAFLAFARATFLSDNRADLPLVRVPTLVLQTAEDAIAPPAVGRYVADTIPDGRLALLDAVGHCPHLTAPDLVVDEIRHFLRTTAPDAGALDASAHGPS